MEQNPRPTDQTPEINPEQQDLLDDVYNDSMEGYDKPIRRVRIILYIIAVLQLIALFTIGDLPEPQNWITMGIYVFFAAVFAVLAWWTKKRPYTAIITALSIYGSLLVIGGIIEPSSIVQGIIIKVVVIVLMISALSNAKEVQKWMDLRKNQ